MSRPCVRCAHHKADHDEPVGWCHGRGDAGDCPCRFYVERAPWWARLLTRILRGLT